MLVRLLSSCICTVQALLCFHQGSTVLSGKVKLFMMQRDILEQRGQCFFSQLQHSCYIYTIPNIHSSAGHIQNQCFLQKHPVTLLPLTVFNVIAMVEGVMARFRLLQALLCLVMSTRVRNLLLSIDLCSSGLLLDSCLEAADGDPQQIHLQWFLSPAAHPVSFHFSSLQLVQQLLNGRSSQVGY